MNHLTRAKSVFEMEIEELRGVLSRLDDNFNKAVDLMSRLWTAATRSSL